MSRPGRGRSLPMMEIPGSSELSVGERVPDYPGTRSFANHDSARKSRSSQAQVLLGAYSSTVSPSVN